MRLDPTGPAWPLVQASDPRTRNAGRRRKAYLGTVDGGCML